jgi:hypothetical protein
VNRSIGVISTTNGRRGSAFEPLLPACWPDLKDQFPTQPDGVADGNWVQTDPDKGWFQLLWLYSPLPSFFDRTWRAGEVEIVN